MITIVDYGLGNLGSIKNILKKIGKQSVISSSVDEISAASKIILPGVGAFDKAMEELESRNFIDILNKKALVEQVPILGICLGMQLLTDGSEEGVKKGFGWIPGKAMRFKERKDIKVPHMGWNIVHKNNNCSLVDTLEQDSRFYFVHSYYVSVLDEKNSMLQTTHGVTFDSGICNKNIMGVQFHPEKSHKYGYELFESFSNI